TRPALIPPARAFLPLGTVASRLPAIVGDRPARSCRPFETRRLRRFGHRVSFCRLHRAPRVALVSRPAPVPLLLRPVAALRVLVPAKNASAGFGSSGPRALGCPNAEGKRKNPMTKNFVEIVGFVGQDPKLSGNAGTSRVRLQVATNERWKDSAGQKRERTEWHTIIFWDRLADAAASLVRKGSHILVT